MLTREQVIEMARECGVVSFNYAYDGSDEEDWKDIERLVQAAYKRGVDDSAAMFYQPHTEFFGDEIQLAIRSLLEE